jgi:hypothetical protein
MGTRATGEPDNVAAAAPQVQAATMRDEMVAKRSLDLGRAVTQTGLFFSCQRLGSGSHAVDEKLRSPTEGPVL